MLPPDLSEGQIQREKKRDLGGTEGCSKPPPPEELPAPARGIGNFSTRVSETPSRVCVFHQDVEKVD